MKNILFVAFCYKQGERVYPTIPELSKHFNVSLLVMHAMSYDGVYKTTNADIDTRDLFHQRYDKYFSKIYRDGDWKTIDYSQFDAIIYDDCRDKGTKIPTKIIYPMAKKHGIKIFGNQHGNRDFKGHVYEIDHHKSVFDYCFLFGEFHKDKCSELTNDTSFLLLGGIPSNDGLKNYKRTKENILIIPNFIEVERKPFPLVFGDKFVKDIKLYDLQQKYGKKVVVKLKPRDLTVGNPYQKDIEYVKSVLKNNSIEGDVIRDIEDDNLLISQAHSVIGITSTLCFKSIQMGIPTAILKGGNFLGGFENFSGVCDINEIEQTIENQIKKGRDIKYIENTIKGGVNYKSTEIYVNEILKILEEQV